MSQWSFGEYCSCTIRLCKKSRSSLLPQATKVPTGLKMDHFAVIVSNLKTNFLLVLPEGHWRNSKTTNEVLCTLHFFLNKMKCSNCTRHATRLRLHADNCSGKNKNRFVLLFLLYLVLYGVFDHVELCFMIARHAKNECASSFCHVKRVFRRKDVIHLRDMMKVISNSSSSSTCISSTEVQWIQWKRFSLNTLKNLLHLRLVNTTTSRFANMLQSLFVLDDCMIFLNLISIQWNLLMIKESLTLFIIILNTKITSDPGKHWVKFHLHITKQSMSICKSK